MSTLLPNRILSPQMSWGTVNEDGTITIDRQWWLYLYALMPENPNSNGVAQPGSVLYISSGAGITGDAGNFDWRGAGPGNGLLIGDGVGGGVVVGTGTATAGGTVNVQELAPQPQQAAANVTAGAGTTLTAAQMCGFVLMRSGPGADFTDTLPNAPWSTAFAQYSYTGRLPLLAINQTAHNWTISPGSNVILNGNLSGGNYVIPATSQRNFWIQLNDGHTPSSRAVMWG